MYPSAEMVFMKISLTRQLHKFHLVPAEAFTIGDCESNVLDCEEAEEEGEDYSGAEGGVGVVLCDAGVGRDVAIGVGIVVMHRRVTAVIDSSS
jgi:hypothetical protein